MACYEMSPIDKLPERLRKKRNEMNFSQETFGKTVGVHRSSISSYENAKRSPRIDLVMDMAEVLDVDVLWLMGYHNDESVGFIETGLDIG